MEKLSEIHLGHLEVMREPFDFEWARKRGFDDLDPPAQEAVNAFARESATATQAAKFLKVKGIGSRLTSALRHTDLSKIPGQAADYVVRAGRGGSMVLTGPPGSGKTLTAAWCFFKIFRRYGKVIVTPSRFEYQWPTTKYVKAHDINRAVFEKNQDFLDACADVRFLWVDDFGAAYDTEWPLREFDHLMDRRWENTRSTILTSNLNATGEGSLESIVPRTLSRLCDEPGPGVVVLDRPDFRKQN